MNTIENNKLIAEFMGADFQYDEFFFPTIAFKEGRNFFKDFELKFHRDWTWLMGAVDKIESLKIGENEVLLESVGKSAKFIFDDGCRFLSDNKAETKIEAVYKAVVEFIKWFNENK